MSYTETSPSVDDLMRAVDEMNYVLANSYPDIDGQSHHGQLNVPSRPDPRNTAEVQKVASTVADWAEERELWLRECGLDKNADQIATIRSTYVDPLV